MAMRNGDKSMPFGNFQINCSCTSYMSMDYTVLRMTYKKIVPPRTIGEMILSCVARALKNFSALFCDLILKNAFTRYMLDKIKLHLAFINSSI